MRVTHLAGLVLAALAGAAAAQSALDAGAAQDARPVVAHTDAGALPPRDAWRCDRIASAWQAWQADGRPSDEWRFAGRRYRDTRNGRVYDWGDWLDWYDESCAAPGLAKSGEGARPPAQPPALAGSGLPGEVAYVGGVFAIGAAIALLGGGGEQNDSPG